MARKQPEGFIVVLQTVRDRYEKFGKEKLIQELADEMYKADRKRIAAVHYQERLMIYLRHAREENRQWRRAEQERMQREIEMIENTPDAY